MTALHGDAGMNEVKLEVLRVEEETFHRAADVGPGALPRDDDVVPRDVCSCSYHANVSTSVISSG